jgi:uncharacterized protein YjiS (DUF1127 family)
MTEGRFFAACDRGHIAVAPTLLRLSHAFDEPRPRSTPVSNVSAFPAQATSSARQRSALSQFFADMFAGIQDGREIAVRYRALARLSPAELATRGLTRQDIPQAALTGLPREAPLHD